ncbi:sugar-transfer associated ATP-grasp domain-containing protein [Eubacterium limosum]|uniref:sugar-transfer associated ATP-grasp domain-containing protein n=1 Tax=Eubacterium limosum TaxID=1736 RepID=UPI00106263C3|nr:sugar-transfer associated ATP-grasp domain-containing protein [Eubacterium limosum]
MRSDFRKKWDSLNAFVEGKYREYSYRKKARTRLRHMNQGYVCDKEYKEIVCPYWKKYGYQPKKMWYQIFADRDQKVDPRYIPDDLWYGKILPYFSNMQFRRFAEDKCFHDFWFSDISRPDTIIKNIAGVFYNNNSEIISLNDAVDICLNYKKEFLIKPSIDSGEGRLIVFINPKIEDKEALLKEFDNMGANYIVQETVSQHAVLAKLNPSSLNTIRVVSFLYEGKVHILSSILRMGASGARIDNVGAGGFACPIREDGALNEFGVNRKSEWKAENQHGIKFSDVKVPSFDKIIEIIKNKHKMLAHFKIIGWDFSVDTGGKPVFIEYNVCPGSNQITCGPTFGELTDSVLEEIFIKKTLENAQN